jgi:TRAP-type C4-dicarboxylate transport system permease small subunit
MLSLNRPPRPRLTLRILAYALADVFGLVCIALGATWFVGKKGLFIAGFPASMAEAVACTVGGIAVMIWAVARILREIGKQGPELQARYAEYIARNHPGAKLPPQGD